MRDNNKPAAVFVLELRPTGSWPAPVEKRLARLLKYALRQCGLRCVGCRAMEDK